MARFSDLDVESLPDVHGPDSMHLRGMPASPWPCASGQYPLDEFEASQEVGNMVQEAPESACPLCGEDVPFGCRKCRGCGAVHKKRVRSGMFG